MKVLALVVKLIELTNIRIGNDAYKKLYGSFGLTTMQDQHVKFEKSKVWFEFIGKKGIKHKMGLHSKKLVNLIKKCKDIPGQDLFQYYTPDGQHCCIGSSDVNNYLKAITGEDYTAKDFRAWWKRQGARVFQETRTSRKSNRIPPTGCRSPR
jgi:DNA topoisomerase-1